MAYDLPGIPSTIFSAGHFGFDGAPTVLGYDITTSPTWTLIDPIGNDLPQTEFVRAVQHYGDYFVYGISDPGGETDNLRVYDATVGPPFVRLATPNAFTQRVEAIAITPDQSTLFVAYRQTAALGAFQLSPWSPISAGSFFTSPNSLAVSPDGTMLAAGDPGNSGVNSLIILDITSFPATPIPFSGGPSDFCLHVDFHPTLPLMSFTDNFPPSMGFIDTSTMTQIPGSLDFFEAGGQVRGAFSHDGQYFAASAEEFFNGTDVFQVTGMDPTQWPRVLHDFQPGVVEWSSDSTLLVLGQGKIFDFSGATPVELVGLYTPRFDQAAPYFQLIPGGAPPPNSGSVNENLEDVTMGSQSMYGYQGSSVPNILEDVTMRGAGSYGLFGVGAMLAGPVSMASVVPVEPTCNENFVGEDLLMNINFRGVASCG